MVCFDILIAYPLSNKTKRNSLQKERLEHLRKYHNADCLGSEIKAGIQYIRYAVCDFDAGSFLRDIPEPMYCIRIKILRTESILYSFYKVTHTKSLPPRDSLVLKQVYWNASQLERRLHLSL